MTIVLYQNAESEENVNYVTVEIGSHIELMAAKLSGRSRDRLYSGMEKCSVSSFVL